jgi:hypothetical protein
VAARCGVALSTSFRWRHRHLAAAKTVQPAVLQGIVEADARFKGVGTNNLNVYLGWRRLMTGSAQTLTAQAYRMAAVA